ncbi:helix-turn-helix domain-containing protein [Lactiplantibacillus herbarum]|uniref:helix-turn-helix domain-containing protein n=1 Tax=Lactiplantibacillus herbarum TaxID=1670446 RepID=UPI00064ED9CB|nr:AraC family transcriptional regulator [Lactiplantibacillus herbarum]
MHDLITDKTINDLFPSIKQLRLIIKNQLDLDAEIFRFEDNPNHFITGFYGRNFKTITSKAPLIRCLYITHGHGNLLLNGESIAVEQNTLLLVNQYTQVELTNLQQCEFIFVAVKTEYFDAPAIVNLLNADNLKQFYFPKDTSTPVPYYNLYILADYLTIGILVYLLLQQILKMPDAYDKSTYMAFVLLINELNTRHPDLKSTATDINLRNELAADILAYTKQHLMDYSLETVARHFHLSPNYLSHLISSATGQTLSNHVREFRLTLARQLLQYSKISIDEVITQLGYSDKTYFYKIFKAETQMTPLQYRKQMTFPTKAG